ncbi:MAG: glycosyltransferase family 4 protein [Chloroflexia bacterium]
MRCARRLRWIGTSTRRTCSCCPSLSEGVPKVLLEAMARALPVVISRTGGIPDIVHNEISGLLVPPRTWRRCRTPSFGWRRTNDLRRRLGEVPCRSPASTRRSARSKE